ncbi:PIN domain-containing protein [uncultured Thiohalocapsa sp.]|uniref:PIN domain-containing protein n=1 Tax=uncultured Thiohalocapsa sp. TaxID=768990 RepID=UPI0025E55E96|nr:PIN domain-containing protein [uncultured Thiohalocapsa sp.]
MSDDVLFFDTNVLVYVFDADAPDKQAIARQLLRDSADIRLSTQVLSEFYVAVTRKLACPLVPARALQVVEHWRRFQVAAVTPELVARGISRSIDAQISFWDGLVVETALAEGAQRLVSEDLHDGWQIGRMHVWNPFR